MRTITMNTKRAALAQAKNQAVMILSHELTQTSDMEGTYKKYVRKFYEWNAQLDSKILEAGKRQDNNPPEQRQGQPSSLNLPTALSPKQKRCPQCRKGIPKTWKRHDDCGWKEEVGK